MTDTGKRKHISRLVLKNLNRLVESADLLSAHGQFGPAVHLMMAAREEAVKWLLLYCWEYLDQRLKSRIYNHLLKHELAGLFYFLSGKIQAIEFAREGFMILARHDPKLGKSARSVAKIIQKKFLQYNPKSFATEINHFLFGIDRTTYEQAHKDSIKFTERDRTASIYVDFDKNYKVGLPQNRLSIANTENTKGMSFWRNTISSGSRAGDQIERFCTVYFRIGNPNFGAL